MIFNKLIKETRRLLIVGGYGSNNLGDEAILAGIVEQVKSINPKIKITVLAHNPKEIKKLHDLPAIKATDFHKFLKFDTLIIGGGSIFRPKMRFRAQLGPLITLFLRAVGKKIIFYSLGIDKKTSSLAKKLLIPAMNGANFVSVRDKRSVAILKKWGVKKKVHIIPDPALGLSYKRLTNKELKALGINPNKKIIGLSLRNLKKLNDLHFIDDLCTLLSQQMTKGHQVVFIPFCRSPINKFENDLYIGRRLKHQLKNKNFIVLEKELNPRQLKSLVARLDLMIGMRLHAMILAIATKTKLIGISYAQKTKTFLEEYNQHVFNPRKLDLKKLNKLLLKKR
tara:strand:+ start:565 stop:1578 length:1014 start_codon:yes stop_codon:yes gene_type:complete